VYKYPMQLIWMKLKLKTLLILGYNVEIKLSYHFGVAVFRFSEKCKLYLKERRFKMGIIALVDN
jgi:hypothetical protein